MFFKTSHKRPRPAEGNSPSISSLVLRDARPFQPPPPKRIHRSYVEDEEDITLNEHNRRTTMEDQAFDYSAPPLPGVRFQQDGPTVYDDIKGRSMPSAPMVYSRKGRRLAYRRTPRGRRMLAKQRSLFRDAMNWRRMRAKVFNRLYTTYGRARRSGYRKTYRSRRYRR